MQSDFRRYYRARCVRFAPLLVLVALSFRSAEAQTPSTTVELAPRTQASGQESPSALYTTKVNVPKTEMRVARRTANIAPLKPIAPPVQSATKSGWRVSRPLITRLPTTIAAPAPVPLRRQMYVPLRTNNTLANSKPATNIAPTIPNRRARVLRIAATPTGTRAGNVAGNRPDASLLGDQDDLLIGNPYHKGGKFEGTPNVAPQPQVTAPRPNAAQRQNVAPPATPRSQTTPSSTPSEVRVDATATPMPPSVPATPPQSTPPINVPSANPPGFESPSTSSQDDLLIGNPHHQGGNYNGSQTTSPATNRTPSSSTSTPVGPVQTPQPPVRSPQLPTQPLVDTTPREATPSTLPQQNAPAPQPTSSQNARAANQKPLTNSVDSVPAEPNYPVTDYPKTNYPTTETPRPQIQQSTPQPGGDELLQGNPYIRRTPAPPSPADVTPQTVESVAPQTSPAPLQSQPPQVQQQQQVQTPEPPRQQPPSQAAEPADSTKPIIDQLNRNAANQHQPAASSNPNAISEFPTPEIPSEPNAPNPFADVRTKEVAAPTPATPQAAEDSDDGDDLFGGLYDDIEQDKEDKQQKREERGEDDSEGASSDEYVDPHFELFSKEMYPSAKACAKCHEQIYKEWAVSSHAYASVSPMFHRFEQKINTLASGTLGYFCVRCHAPVATQMGIERDQPLMEHIPAAYEGVTCIACHRVNERYTRVNGERRIEPGSIFNPVYGGSSGSGLDHVIAHKEHYKVKTSPHETGPGQDIHSQAKFFDQIGKSEFCVSCHQVSVFPGIKLEVVWEQYRASPACKAGISCQDCHMGKVPGKPLGYATAPGAVVGGKPVNPNRKHSNHMFFGPGYSVAHPGIFPFNLKTEEYDWKAQDWLQFDYRAGWGSEWFEQMVENGQISPGIFPPVWAEADDRRDAWEIVQENMDTMSYEKRVRRQLMENSSHIDGPFFDSKPRCGKPLKFHYDVSNLNSGHNAPSGSLGAQPQIWVNTVLVNPRGQRVWESGYTDAIGDVADTLSLEVAAGRCKPDHQLVNFQSKFLFTSAKGTDREWFLPINIDIDQLPFIRPSGLPITTLNHPPFIRMEQRSLPPLSSRVAKYRVPAEAMSMPGKYRLSVRLRSRSHPVYFVRFCEGTPDMERRINEGMLDFHEDTVEFYVR